MANLEKIKEIRDCRKDKSPTVLELHLSYVRDTAFSFSVGEVRDLIDKNAVDDVIKGYEDIIEYLVERLVHCDSERFS